MYRTTKPRLFGIGATLALAASCVAVGTSTLSAGAVPPTITTEADCYNGLAKLAVPFVVGATAVATKGGVPIATAKYPTGVTFGAAGAISVSLPGPVVAGLRAAAAPILTGASIDLDFTVTARNASGTYHYSPAAGAGGLAVGAHNMTNQPFNGRRITTGVTLTVGSAVIAGASGTFVPADVTGVTGFSFDWSTLTPSGTPAVDQTVARFVSGGADPTGVGGANVIALAATSVILSVSPDGSHALLAAPVTGPAGDSASSPSVGVGFGQNWVDSTFSTGDVFTTAGVPTQNAELVISSISGFWLNTNVLPLGFGAFDTPAAACAVGGYDSSGTPGGAVVALPAGTTTPLVSVSPLLFPGFAPVALGDPAPTPVSQGLNVGTGTTTPITLSATDSGDGTPATPATFVKLSTPLPAAGVLYAGAAVPGNEAVVGTEYPIATVFNYVAPSSPSVQTFTFTAADTIAIPTPPGGTTNRYGVGIGTVTLNVGTPPVDQQITQDVTAGQLVLSCQAPGTPGWPLLTCPVIQLPAVQLNGVENYPTHAMNRIWVSDNRGDVTQGWSLSSYMLPQSTGAGTYLGFVNTAAGADKTLPANRIPAANLSIGTIACVPVSPAPAAVATTGAGGTYATNQALCSAAAGTSIGTFTVDGTFTLHVPSSVAKGTYSGTVEYLVV